MHQTRVNKDNFLRYYNEISFHPTIINVVYTYFFLFYLHIKETVETVCGTGTLSE